MLLESSSHNQAFFCITVCTKAHIVDKTYVARSYGRALVANISKEASTEHTQYHYGTPRNSLAPSNQEITM
eukprot:2892393-Amphidinium_carterae.1